MSWIIDLITRSPKRSAIAGVALAILSVIGIHSFKIWMQRPTPAKIAAGEALFLHEWEVNDPLCGEGDGLGPVFNANSCIHCHAQGGVGGSGGQVGDVTSFLVIPNRERKNVITSVVHADAVSEDLLESQATVRELFPRITSSIELAMNGCAGSTTVEQSFDPIRFENIDSPALFGIGLLDEISDFSIAVHGGQRMTSKIKREFGGDFTGNGIGLARTLSNGRIGKFGWKGQFASVEDFVASACAMELGLTNPEFSQPIARKHQQDKNAKLDMTRKQLHELVTFVKSLPAPKQILPMDPVARQRAIEGEALFKEAQCTQCHVQDLGSVAGVYSDFHLYSLEDPQSSAAFTGGGYGMQLVPEEFELPSSEPLPDQWRTPPLWGVADSAPYFHDGRASTLENAITNHLGQAQHSLDIFNEFTMDDRKKVVEFLKTLRAPQQATETEDKFAKR